MSPPREPEDRWAQVFGIVLCLALIAAFVLAFYDTCWLAPEPTQECPPPPHDQELRQEVEALRLEVESLDEQIGVVWELTNIVEDRTPLEVCEVFHEARLLTEAEYIRCQVEAADDAPWPE